MFGGAIFSPYARALAPSTYIKQTVDAAQGVQREYKVPASVAMAQSILESGWGDSTLSRTYHNYFGIKCTSQKSRFQQGCVSLKTNEYTSSGTTTIVDGFRTYATTADSFSDYGLLLSSLSRYRAAFSHTDDPDQFIRAIAAGGYATDPAYADSVIRIMKQYNLYQYDKLPAPQPTANPVADQTQTPTPTPKPTSATPSPSRSASASPSARPSASPSATPSAKPSATPSASPSASTAPDAKPAGLTGVIWVINPQTNRVSFSGTVYDADGKPLVNTALAVVDTTGASLGTVTTDAQGRLNAGVNLPAGWAKISNYEVIIRFPGAGGTGYTEGATTIPAGATTSSSGPLTTGDPSVASASDTGLDRDDNLPAGAPSASATASRPAAASASPSASSSPSVKPVWPAGQASPSTKAPATKAPSTKASPAPSPASSSAPAVPASHTGGSADDPAQNLAGRLPRTGGPAAVFGLLGLGILAAGATLVATSRGARNQS
ncbi:glucosaminidase domain-containing protein [Raineyella sp. LH-20]|uniref:glucosaminidase domain-containing protein n=1 Tax=Raineyella sp. LH-20 TaxID=3081204 RepID=UPI00295322FC|nr:glucosaminidase domain-containing protein [Raineyella sp. LH-20]WOP18232.1 glucosaminidase domain-containing protein [Raineyella sp. LH-20]